jgi:hypothetical protein
MKQRIIFKTDLIEVCLQIFHLITNEWVCLNLLVNFKLLGMLEVCFLYLMIYMYVHVFQLIDFGSRIGDLHSDTRPYQQAIETVQSNIKWAKNSMDTIDRWLDRMVTSH